MKRDVQDEEIIERIVASGTGEGEPEFFIPRQTDITQEQLIEIIKKAEKEQTLELDLPNKGITQLPPEIVQQGTHAVFAFLRGQLQPGRPQWISKLLMVGEGGVGKSSLLRALHHKDFNPQLSTTHGIEIDTLELEHPSGHIEEMTMQLKTWDFGGQDIYHAIHQFFLTNNSLFLLVWNVRHGYEQGKLYYWMDTIQAKAPDSPVLLVATHIDKRVADLPLKDFRHKYPNIVGQCEISNKTGEGIEVLRKAIADAAADLPLMGEKWPETWLDAAYAIRVMQEKYITPEIMEGYVLQRSS